MFVKVSECLFFMNISRGRAFPFVIICYNNIVVVKDKIRQRAAKGKGTFKRPDFSSLDTGNRIGRDIEDDETDGSDTRSDPITFQSSNASSKMQTHQSGSDE